MFSTSELFSIGIASILVGLLIRKDELLCEQQQLLKEVAHDNMQLRLRILDDISEQI
jgi:hypothetical protein